MANINVKKGVIGILTGGGDVPGLNPAIRAVTFRALREGGNQRPVDSAAQPPGDEPVAAADQHVAGILYRRGEAGPQELALEPEFRSQQRGAPGSWRSLRSGPSWRR